MASEDLPEEEGIVPITDGPSMFDLMFSLFDEGIGRRVVRFESRDEEGIGGTITVAITSLKRQYEDYNTGWFFSGSAHVASRNHPFERWEGYRKIEGFFATNKRRGWFRLVE